MAKSKKFVALFRTQWTSAKAAATPAALKRVDFSKGLGPMLDQLEKKWDAAADLDPVPAKSLTELEGLVTKFQAVVKNYQQQVIKANDDDPGNGPSWMALHGALYKIDQGLVQDMKELGVKCAWVKGWASNSDFDRLAGKTQTAAGGQPAPEEDSAAYRTQAFESLLDKLNRAPKGDTLAFAKALDIGLSTCLPHARELVKKLRGFSAALVTTVTAFTNEMKATKPDPKKAMTHVEQAAQIVKQLLAALPPEGKPIASPVLAALKAMNDSVRAKIGA
jgi:hypothetical protein